MLALLYIQFKHKLIMDGQFLFRWIELSCIVSIALFKRNIQAPSCSSFFFQIQIAWEWIFKCCLILSQVWRIHLKITSSNKYLSFYILITGSGCCIKVRKGNLIYLLSYKYWRLTLDQCSNQTLGTGTKCKVNQLRYQLIVMFNYYLALYQPAYLIILLSYLLGYKT